MRGAPQGSPQVFEAEELYTANAQRAGRLAYFLLVGDRELAQDLVQEAFLKVFARWGNPREPQSCAAYLNRRIVNLGHKTHRGAGSNGAISSLKPHKTGFD